MGGGQKSTPPFFGSYILCEVDLLKAIEFRSVLWALCVDLDLGCEELFSCIWTP